MAKFRQVMDPTDPQQVQLGSQLAWAASHPYPGGSASGVQDISPDPSHPAGSH